MGNELYYLVLFLNLGYFHFTFGYHVYLLTCTMEVSLL